MTTTTEKKPPAPEAAKTIANLDELDGAAFDGAIEKGQRTTGGFEGPSWVPMLAEKYNPDLKPEALAKKVEKSGPGSTTRGALGGKLVAAFAWGRRMYFLDVETKTGVVRVKLPESKLLANGLNLCELGAKVAVRYDGPGKPSKPGRKPPHLFTVASVDRPALAAARKDSIYPESMDEREARKKADELRAVRAQNAAAGIAGGDHDDGEDDGEDAPF